MADTADRRSERNLSETKQAKKERARYRNHKACGICVYAGCEAEVRDRAYCYEHSSYQSRATYKSGARHFAKLAGIDISSGEVTQEQIKRFLELIAY